MISRSRESGFLYIEVLASVTLLAFGLLAIAPMFILSSKENASASDLTMASTAATDKAEFLKRAHYATVTTGADVVTMRSVGFDRVWTVQTDVPYAYMKTVTVTVTPRRGRRTFGPNRVATVRFFRVPS